MSVLVRQRGSRQRQVASRLEELEAGEINHALYLVIACHNTFEGPARPTAGGVSGDAGVVHPAAALGRRCLDVPAYAWSVFNANAPAMGAHFFYDRTPEEIDGDGANPLEYPDGGQLPAWKRTILKALSRYGAFVSDTGGSPPDGGTFVRDGLSFEHENSYQYAQQDGGVRAMVPPCVSVVVAPIG